MADSEKVSSLPSERERFESYLRDRYGLSDGWFRWVHGDRDHSYVYSQAEWEAWQAASAGRQELRDALQKTSDMLSSACFFVPKASGLMPMLDQVEKARATLAKHGG